MIMYDHSRVPKKLCFFINDDFLKISYLQQCRIININKSSLFQHPKHFPRENNNMLNAIQEEPYCLREQTQESIGENAPHIVS